MTGIHESSIKILAFHYICFKHILEKILFGWKWRLPHCMCWSTLVSNVKVEETQLFISWGIHEKWRNRPIFLNVGKEKKKVWCSGILPLSIRIWECKKIRIPCNKCYHSERIFTNLMNFLVTFSKNIYLFMCIWLFGKLNKQIALVQFCTSFFILLFPINIIHKYLSYSWFSDIKSYF